MEVNNNDNNKVRLTSLDEIGHMEKAGEGFRSKTIKETIALNNIERMVMKRRLNGEKLKLRNNDKTRYFILENGVVFKIDDNTFFYELNQETLQWQSNQAIASIYYDGFLRPMELVYFKDYFDNEEEMELDGGSGRHL